MDPASRTISYGRPPTGSPKIAFSIITNLLCKINCLEELLSCALGVIFYNMLHCEGYGHLCSTPFREISLIYNILLPNWLGLVV